MTSMEAWSRLVLFQDTSFYSRERIFDRMLRKVVIARIGGRDKVYSVMLFRLKEYYFSLSAYFSNFYLSVSPHFLIDPIFDPIAEWGSKDNSLPYRVVNLHVNDNYVPTSHSPANFVFSTKYSYEPSAESTHCFTDKPTTDFILTERTGIKRSFVYDAVDKSSIFLTESNKKKKEEKEEEEMPMDLIHIFHDYTVGTRDGWKNVFCNVILELKQQFYSIFSFDDLNKNSSFVQDFPVNLTHDLRCTDEIQNMSEFTGIRTYWLIHLGSIFYSI